jgi:hypothetical protein
VYHLAHAFHVAAGDDGGAVAQGAAILFLDGGADDKVGDAGFVFDGHEHDAAGGAGALADEGEAGDGDRTAVGPAFFFGEIAAGSDRAGGKGLAHKGKWVGLQRKSQSGTVMHDPGGRGDCRERLSFFCNAFSTAALSFSGFRTAMTLPSGPMRPHLMHFHKETTG